MQAKPQNPMAGVSPSSQAISAPRAVPAPRPVPIAGAPRPVAMPGAGAAAGHVAMPPQPVVSQPVPQATPHISHPSQSPQRAVQSPPAQIVQNAPQNMPQNTPMGQVARQPQAAMPPQAPVPVQQAIPDSGLHGLTAQSMDQDSASPMGEREDGPRTEGDKIIPGISIEAFCERNETGSVLHQATKDWRMKRANLDIFMGGLGAAIDYYQNEDTPNLIIIESSQVGPALFAQLEALASVCQEDTNVVVIGLNNDIRLYRQLIEKGVSDYIVPPFKPMTFIRSISELYVSEEQPYIGRSVAIFGAKGGVGTSTIAHNLAWILSDSLYQETALIDLDESWGTTAIDFAYDTAQGLEEALGQATRLDDALLDKILIRHSKKLSILPTAASLSAGNGHFDPIDFETVINGIRSLSPLSLLDMPHIWTQWASETLVAADEIVIVATLDLASLRNTKNLVTFLQDNRPHDKDPLILVNMVGRSKHEIDLDEFAAQIGIEPCTILNFDPDMFTEAAIDGKMITDMPGSETHMAHLRYLATRLKTGRFQHAPSNLDADGSAGSIFNTILSKFTKKS